MANSQEEKKGGLILFKMALYIQDNESAWKETALESKSDPMELNTTVSLSPPFPLTPIGEWKNNQAKGNGTFTHVDGDIYTGEWKEDQASGYGEYSHKNGSVYKGHWLNDVQHGEGEEHWPDG